MDPFGKPTHVKRLRPDHLKMIQLHWQGRDNSEIASALGFTPQQVSNVLNSPLARSLLDQLQNSTLDSMGEVNAELQLAAPIAAERLIHQLHSPNEVIANRAANQILDRAHGTPLKRVQVQATSQIDKRYEGKTEAEIRQAMLDELGSLGIIEQQLGPDGKPLN